MKAFDVPGLAIGIATGDKLVYAKGFGVRSEEGGVPVECARSSRSGQLPRRANEINLRIRDALYRAAGSRPIHQ